MTGTKLHCSVTDRGTDVCEQLAQGCYLKAERPRAGGRTRDRLSRKSNALTTTPPGHTCDSLPVLNLLSKQMSTCPLLQTD